MFNVLNDHPALIDGDNGQIVTYRDLHEASQSFLIKKRSLVFLFNKNLLADVVAYVCVINSGSVCCLLDGNMHESFKRRLIKIYSPDYIFSDETQMDDYIKHSSGIFQSNKSTSPMMNEKLQLLLATSGTTGNPKFIRLSRNNLTANAKSIIDYLNIDANQRAIASLPFHYSFGLSVLHTHLIAGASIVLTQSSVAQQTFWDIVRKFGCTCLSGVPYTYKVMERVGFLNMDLPSLLTLTQAGGRLETSLILKFKQKIERFFVMYGQTEATARIAFLPPEYLPEKAGAIGMAIPGGKLRIVDDQKEMTLPKKIGELIYEGPNVMLGYADNVADLIKGDEMNGVLHTGDVGYFDEDHIFYVTGRIKRISKIYGLRINLDDLEMELMPYGNVAVTSSDEKIFIYIEGALQETLNKCMAHLTSLYELHPSTFKCISIPRLPRTSSGKMDYQGLK